jgi:hypothetical protein
MDGNAMGEVAGALSDIIEIAESGPLSSYTTLAEVSSARPYAKRFRGSPISSALRIISNG